ncbi:lantibiotic dehydratase [Stackebrandtia nassauensis]|uniref:Lantibiotic dehydratase domain protein n=1 Tax=Stackebrandtia nassauensis (strain DSM 44728 / CIP 108903 / NRRL B-16338 / NBRC 102104 / LLR-40K-21) TaxID=446470 RepID=D3Q0W1_STANL|nr:lantibiotic dehydratase [Stackebrandtia nassauensis]ADD43711.1 Lantibiotic dehydratase domain protein [Stackebrandtia nassauensis DSM 44728]
MSAEHLIPLPGSDWKLWRECSLRSAGFPVELASRFSDPAIVREALAEESGGDFVDRYTEAVDRSVKALRSFVELPGFREAVAWQNPAILHNWLTKMAHSGDDRKLRKNRYMKAVASYAQRYFTKNDTIGFFGPVGWATWDDDVAELQVTTGAKLLRRRATYFETWAIEALAGVLAEDPRLRPWLRPRLVAGCWRDASSVNRPYAAPFPLDAEQAALLDACDGSRTVRQLAQAFETSQRWDEPEIISQLTTWCDQELVELDFAGPIEARPELRLRQQLESIGDDEARLHALEQLTRLEAARYRVTLSRGDPEGVADACVNLARVFEDITKRKSSRNDGKMYAGRTLVYEDTRRDVDVTLGASVLAELAPPLRIVLDSAAWLIARAGEVLHDRLRDLVRAYQSDTGGSGMPLPELLARSTPILHPWNPGDSPLGAVREEFQSRWARVLGEPEWVQSWQTDPEPADAPPPDDPEEPDTVKPRPPPRGPDDAGTVKPKPPPRGPDEATLADGETASGHRPDEVAIGEARAPRRQFASRDLVERAARLFPPAPAPWAGAMHLSPDIMIAARDAQAVNDGDFAFVLGELHLANNTLQARPFVEMHDDPDALLAATESDFGDERVYYVPTRKSPQVNSRAYPSAILPPSYTYWCLHDDSGGAAGPVIPAGTMTVFLDGDRLRVRDRDGREFGLLAVLDEQLAWPIADIFAPIPKRRHQPRFSIDKLVLHRESWHFLADELDWAFASTPAERFREAQHWCREQAIPSRVFYKLSTEEKPCFGDLSSVALVECLAQAIRAAVEQDETATVGLSEMLPDLHQAWLPGPDGEMYTSELRFVAVNPHGTDNILDTPS